LTPELELFKAYLYEAPGVLWPGDIRSQYELLGIPASLSYSGAVVGDKLYDQIRKALRVDIKDKDKVSYLFVNHLINELCYRQILEAEPAEEEIGILKSIKYSLQHEVMYLPPITDSEKWRKAITVAKQCLAHSPNSYKYAYDDLRMEMPRPFDVAMAVKELIGFGCRYECYAGKLRITQGLEQVVSKLEKLIAQFGASEWIDYIFDDLEKKGHYSTHYERYHIFRQGNWRLEDQFGQIPYGYLFFLSLNILPGKRPKYIKMPDPNLIYDLAATLVQGAYDVQPYFGMEYMVTKGMSFLDMCQEIVIWDSIFAFHQTRLNETVELNRQLLACISEQEFMTAMGFSQDLFFKVCTEICATTFRRKSMVAIYVSKITASLGSEFKKEIISILQVLSHQQGFNAGYLLPVDVEKNNYLQKPLLQVGETKFILPCPSVGAPTFFEAAASMLRKSVKQFDNRIGLQTENYLVQRLLHKGLKVAAGKYQMGHLHGECDLLLETKEAIVLIECKKKPLTRKSKSGTTVNLILDLADSLLSASLQNGRTEIFLRQKGSLVLTDKNNTVKEVHLNGREICSISLTLLDYGGLHDPVVSKKVLEALVGYSVSTENVSPGIKAKFDNLEKNRQRWNAQYHQLAALQPRFEHSPFYDSMFMSLAQFIEVLDESRDAASFYTSLRLNKNLNRGTLDWYKERESYFQLHR